jgi:hypothetical protein
MLVLADRGDEQKVIEEERQEWLIEVLLALNVPAQAFELELEEMRDYLMSADIEVWHHADGTLDIYKDDEIVAQWNEPELILIKETPKKWYYEIHINAWARPLQKLDL